MKPIWPLLLVAALASGCGSSDGFDDLRQFMDEAGKKSAPKVEPLPPPQPHDTFVFNAEQVPDPFVSRSAQAPAQSDSGQTAGTLEAYALDTLTVMGLIEKGGVAHALLATPENRLLPAKVGDRIGRNHGVVIEVSDKGVKVKERVMTTKGGWKEIVTELNKPQDASIREMKRDASGKWTYPN